MTVSRYGDEIEPIEKRTEICEKFCEIWFQRIQPFRSHIHTLAEHDLSSWVTQYRKVFGEGISLIYGVRNSCFVTGQKSSRRPIN